MKIYTLYREQFLPVSLDTAWQFFSAPGNLSKITPDDMGFTVITQLKDEAIFEGMHIEYRLRPLWGIPMKWITEIGVVQPGVKFVDRQLKGPYSFWEHTHIFKAKGSGVLMIDELKYALPLGIIGQMMHFAIVKKKINDIFNYRSETLSTYFG